jgi:GT2 family glycosyltransferase
MISVITCSIDPIKFAAVEAMYKTAFGSEPWELVGIHDARSLAEGYNRGVAQSKGEIVVFSHDDIEILSPDLAGRVRGHLSRFDLIGVVGTTKVINAGWMAAGPPDLFGQILHARENGTLLADIIGAPSRAVANIQGLDGVFMAARRSLLDSVKFDAETFDGFHLYDMDFSYGAFKAGFKLGVACDINVFHQSRGEFGDVFMKYAERFGRKWKLTAPIVRARAFSWTQVAVKSKQEAVEVMTPPNW